MATASFVINNKINMPVIDDPDETAPNRLDSVYGNFEYSFDVTFSVTLESFVATVTNVEVLDAPEWVDFTSFSSDTIRIFKNSVAAFQGEFFQFVSFDAQWEQTIEIKQVGDETNNDSIVKWNPPPVKLIADVPHSFRVFYTSSENPAIVQSVDFNAIQDVHWNLDSSLNIFNTLVQESKF